MFGSTILRDVSVGSPTLHFCARVTRTNDPIGRISADQSIATFRGQICQDSLYIYFIFMCVFYLRRLEYFIIATTSESTGNNVV